MEKIIELFDRLEKNYKAFLISSLFHIPFWFLSIFIFNRGLIINYPIYISITLTICLTIVSALIYFIISIIAYKRHNIFDSSIFGTVLFIYEVKNLKKREVLRIELIRKLNILKNRYEVAIENNDISEIEQIHKSINDINDIVMDLAKNRNKSVIFNDLENSISELEETLDIKKGVTN